MSLNPAVSLDNWKGCVHFSLENHVRIVRLMRSMQTFRAIALLSALVSACAGSTTSPSDSAAFAKTDLREGTGTAAATGSVLTVHYTGWLYDPSKPDQKGAQFDSSRGGTAFTFGLGAGQVIVGWDQGLPGMRVGGLRRLVIPPSLAYGQNRNGGIPPNATLVFEIELLEVL